MAKILSVLATVEKQSTGSSSRQTYIEAARDYAISTPAVVGTPLQQVQMPAAAEGPPVVPTVVDIDTSQVPDIRGLVIRVVTDRVAIKIQLEDPGTVIEIDQLFMVTFSAGAASNPALIRLINENTDTAVDVEIWVMGDVL